jgi:hypothetical protein
MADLLANRRDLLAASLLTALPLALAAERAHASKIEPWQTIVKLPDQIEWKSNSGFPEKSVDMAPLFGSVNETGIYYTLVRWHPGYMSAPHSYVTDRLCVVVSGTWWVNSGADFDPDNTIPAPAGTYVRRVANTPHYDGVKKDGAEPAIIAICGIGPVNVTWLVPGTAPWRKL